MGESYQPQHASDSFDMTPGEIWHRVKINQIKMVRDRGYQISPEEREILEMSTEDFVARYAEKAEEDDVNFNFTLSTCYTREEAALEEHERHVPLCAIYLSRDRESKMISKDEVKMQFARYYEEGAAGLRVVFISEIPVGREGKEAIEKIRNMQFQFFLTEELLFNPTEHKFYLPHRLLAPSEREAFLEQNKLTPDKMPAIHESDAIVRYFQWPVGGIVEIYRTSLFLELPAPESYYYRRIVKGPSS